MISENVKESLLGAAKVVDYAKRVMTTAPAPPNNGAIYVELAQILDRFQTTYATELASIQKEADFNDVGCTWKTTALCPAPVSLVFRLELLNAKMRSDGDRVTALDLEWKAQSKREQIPVPGPSGEGECSVFNPGACAKAAVTSLGTWLLVGFGLYFGYKLLFHKLSRD